MLTTSLLCEIRTSYNLAICLARWNRIPYMYIPGCKFRPMDSDCIRSLYSLMAEVGVK